MTTSMTAQQRTGSTTGRGIRAELATLWAAMRAVPPPPRPDASALTRR